MRSHRPAATPSTSLADRSAARVALVPASNGARLASLTGSLIVLGAALALGCGPRATTVHAQVSPSAPVEGITVTGFGKAAGAPDIARTNLGVEIRAASADEAMREVNTRVNAVIAALKKLGIADADLRTQGLSLNFEQNEPPRPMPEVPPVTPAPRPGARPGKDAPAPEPQVAPGPPPGHYRASNTLQVTIRNLDRAGEVLGTASAAGANLMYGLEFDVENKAPLEAIARQKAVADARARAEALAQLSGVALGRVLSVNESGSTNPPPGPVMMMRSEAANQVPFERGELTITNSVTIVYALAK